MKRHPALQPLSKEHRTVLSFCLHLEKGVKNSVKVDRIQLYIHWFWESYLKLHFKVEEYELFPLLPATDNDVVNAIEEHRIIEKLCQQNSMSNRSILDLMELLKSHVRLEERKLYNKIQDEIPEEQLKIALQDIDKSMSCSLYQDVFWD